MSIDGYSKGNPRIIVVVLIFVIIRVLFNCHWLFSWVLSNIFTELMAICEGLDFAA